MEHFPELGGVAAFVKSGFRILRSPLHGALLMGCRGFCCRFCRRRCCLLCYVCDCFAWRLSRRVPGFVLVSPRCLPQPGYLYLPPCTPLLILSGFMGFAGGVLPSRGIMPRFSSRNSRSVMVPFFRLHSGKRVACCAGYPVRPAPGGSCVLSGFDGSRNGSRSSCRHRSATGRPVKNNGP